MILPLPAYIRRTYNRYRHRQPLRRLRHFYHSLLTFLSKMDPTSSPPQSDTTSIPDPPPFNPKEPAIPISYPLQTLEELESRSYFDSFHFPFNKSTVKLRNGGSDCAALPQRPRLLVCHDMAGGYVDDKWVQGGSNPDAYAIWHWYLMDVFVYFSHTLVTLPPPCWTNVAHKHGVKVLGTFILEWDAGRTMANKLLSSKESAHMYAERLAELAQALGFDGWLINMEIKLNVGQIPNLKEFVSHLTQTMHSSVSGSLVIWYDSVTVEGSLDWQDQLNEKNKAFFDLCDGIFMNYTWKEGYPKKSAFVAGDRRLDVYMGIDVFGRNTYGGGQWTTDVALDLIKKDDVSAAIFAPGWIYETKQPPNFETAQNRWWGLVEKSWGISQKYPNTLPFYSNFDQGHGYHFSVAGAQVSNAPWNNISSQSFQPFLEHTGNSAVDTVQVSIGRFDEASYGGGGNLTFKGTLDGNAYFTKRLFVGELVLEDKPLHFIYSMKSNGRSLIGLSLEFSSTIRGKRLVLLAAHGNTLLTMNHFSSRYSAVVMPHSVSNIEDAPGWILQESSINMAGDVLTEIRVVCYTSKPAVNVVQSEYEDHRMALSTGQLEYHAVLGHLLVTASSSEPDFPPSTLWIVEGKYIKWGAGSNGSRKLSMQLLWNLRDGDTSVFSNYNIYVQRVKGAVEDVAEYLGVANVEAFYVSDLVFTSATTSIKFIIQLCNLEGATQKLQDSPFFQLQVEGLMSSPMESSSHNMLLKNPQSWCHNGQETNGLIVDSETPRTGMLSIIEDKDGREVWIWCSPLSFGGKKIHRVEATMDLIDHIMGRLNFLISCCMGLLYLYFLLLLVLK